MEPALEPTVPRNRPELREEPPSRFDGWRVVGAALVSQGVAIGFTVSSYSLFVESIEADLGATRAQTNLGISILLAMGALISPALGRVIDRGPARVVMLTGVIWTAIGFALLSQASSLLGFAIVLGAMIGAGHAMFGPLPAMTVVANWFIARRGTAIGIVSIGTTLGGFIMPPVAASLIGAYGWRGALQFYAVGCAAIAFPLIWLWMVKRPEDVGQFPDGRPGAAHPAGEGYAAGSGGLGLLLRQPTFWLLAAIFGLMTTAPITMLSNLVPYASDLGISRPQAALVLSCFALSTAAGKILFGLSADRFDERVALALSLAIQTGAWLIFLSQPGLGLFLVGGALFGLGAGGVMPLQGAMIGAAFGRAIFGQVMGLMGPVMLVFTVAAPPLVGYLYDATASYTLPFTMLLGAFAGPAILLLFLRLPR
jgi:MFS family permease